MDWLIAILFIVCLLTGVLASLAGVWLGCWISWRWGRVEKLLPPKPKEMPLSVSENEIDEDDREDDRDIVEYKDTLEEATL